MKKKALILLGLQWGDEGKGKVVDILSADFVIRFQGGSNAGHTICIKNKKIILHQVPSGILNPSCEVLLGSGMVIDLQQLSAEIQELEKQNISCGNRIFISELAHIILPIHKIKDILSEIKKKKEVIGTTKKGIGPAYIDKVARNGIRVCDLNESKDFQQKFLEKMQFFYQEIEADCKKHELELPNIEESYQELMESYQKIKSFICDPLALVIAKKKEAKKILLEGAQGAFLDVDYGSYPFVTSSHTTIGGAFTGSELSFQDIQGVLGLCKAYTTRVGKGPFPTELFDNDGKLLQEKGNEFGSTTGRTRRCGWLDLCLLRKSIFLNSVSYLALMKLDVLDSFTKIKVCTHYKLEGKTLLMPPNNTHLWEKLEPQYKIFDGWQASTSKIKDFSKLPENCQIFINFLQKELKCFIVFVSTSPQREDYILREKFF